MASKFFYSFFFCLVLRSWLEYCVLRFLFFLFIRVPFNGLLNLSIEFAPLGEYVLSFIYLEGLDSSIASYLLVCFCVSLIYVGGLLGEVVACVVWGYGYFGAVWWPVFFSVR